MPRIRRHNLPRPLYAHLLERIQQRDTSRQQLKLWVMEFFSGFHIYRLIVVTVALILAGGCSREPQLKYKIDGDSEDWKIFQTGWMETGVDWSKVTVTPAFDDFDLKEFYYDNDQTYLYLFFKCTPSVSERYEKTKRTGALGHLYIDSDMNTNTGADSSTVPGADIQVYLPVGMYANDSARDGFSSGCYVTYEMQRWDSVSKAFGEDVRKEDSRSPSPLIGHGKAESRLHCCWLICKRAREASSHSLVGKVCRHGIISAEQL